MSHTARHRHSPDLAGNEAGLGGVGEVGRESDGLNEDFVTAIVHHANLNSKLGCE